MARIDYIVHRPRSADIDANPDGENYLARTVYEDKETIDIGLMDSEGNKILVRRRMDPIGFVRFKD